DPDRLLPAVLRAVLRRADGSRASRAQQEPDRDRGRL
ncbi:MAG: hypothetical protein AVDCRST_MAG38-2153, partial [uncultured Solirubrobacteraceae bacterium]